jgi:CRISPR-associated endonuclease/helicase Cas3
VLTVAGLNPERLPDLKTTRWGFYDEYVLYRSWAFASRETHWRLPQDIDRMVQAVYGHDELPAGLDAAIAKKIEVGAFGRHLADVDRERLLARYAAIDARAEMQNAYANLPRGNEDGDFGNRNVTRLGPESLVVVPMHVAGGLWRLRAEDAGFDPSTPPDPELARAIVQRQLRLTRHDVVKALRDTEPPAGWAEHPWLRHVKALPLAGDGSCTLEKTSVGLDPELGITYRATSTGSDA